MTPLQAYNTLGVQPGASPETIKAAYRRLARQHHPDVNPSPNATKLMADINQAHGILTGRIPARISQVGFPTNGGLGDLFIFIAEAFVSVMAEAANQRAATTRKPAKRKKKKQTKKRRAKSKVRVGPPKQQRKAVAV